MFKINDLLGTLTFFLNLTVCYSSTETWRVGLVLNSSQNADIMLKLEESENRT